MPSDRGMNRSKVDPGSSSPSGRSSRRLSTSVVSPLEVTTATQVPASGSSRLTRTPASSGPVISVEVMSSPSRHSLIFSQTRRDIGRSDTHRQAGSATLVSHRPRRGLGQPGSPAVQSAQHPSYHPSVDGTDDRVLQGCVKKWAGIFYQGQGAAPLLRVGGEAVGG